MIRKIYYPMLCQPAKPFDDPNWLFELKLDGTRVITYIDEKKIIMRNRRMKDILYRYPEFRDVRKYVKAKEVVLDGELVVLDDKGKPNFYKLASREQTEERLKIEIYSQTMPATYFVFDILYKDGKDLTKLPLKKRKEILSKTIKDNPKVLVLDYVMEKGKELFKAVKKKGLEGIVAKKMNSKYESGVRSKNWLKIKSLKTVDCIIVGYTKGKGKRENTFGALVLSLYDHNNLRYIGRVGTGWNERELKEIKEKLEKVKSKKPPLKEIPKELEKFEVTWLKPKYVCEVKYMNVSPKLELRAPSFIRMRNDKPPKDCTISDLL